jgi:hypothetical protein
MARPSNELRQVRELQEVYFQLALQTAKKAIETGFHDDAMAAAAAGKTWDTVTNRKRIICGKPMPGSLKPIPTVSAPKPKRPTNKPPTVYIPGGS